MMTDEQNDVFEYYHSSGDDTPEEIIRKFIGREIEGVVMNVEDQSHRVYWALCNGEPISSRELLALRSSVDQLNEAVTLLEGLRDHPDVFEQ